MSIKVLVCYTLLALFAPTIAAANQKLNNLEAFAKTYGYVRYFYPGDEASMVDWDAFAIYGSQQVESAEDDQALMTVLARLFRPVAPLIKFHRPEDNHALTSDIQDVANLTPMYWQHLGLGGTSNLYKSKRVGRKSQEDKDDSTMQGSIAQVVDIREYRGLEFRLSGWIKSESNDMGRLWARVHAEGRSMGFRDMLLGRPIMSPAWQQTSLSGTIDQTAELLLFGMLVTYDYTAWGDSFRLEIKNARGKWQAVEIENPGFEVWHNSKPELWLTPSAAHVYAQETTDVHGGQSAIKIMPLDVFAPETRLFATKPALDASVNERITTSVSLHMPMVVYGDSEHTYPINTAAAQTLIEQTKNVNKSLTNKYLQLADIIVLWSTMQHFYPYFDVIDTDWANVLRSSLLAIQDGVTQGGFEAVLKRMLVALQDGHAGVRLPSGNRPLALPLEFTLAEGQIVVIRSNDDKVKVGDIVLELNGQAALQQYQDVRALVSGSDQWRRSNTLALMRFSEDLKVATMVLKRGRQDISVSIPYGEILTLLEGELAAISELEPNIHYVDLSRATMSDIKDRLEQFKNASGIVFDLRRYPDPSYANHEVISHLLDAQDTSVEWLQIPQIVYPDGHNKQWARKGWSMTTASPRIDAKVIFITGGRAISYAESILSFIEHYKLGEIVGQPTAGTNGDINHLRLPSGSMVRFTGTRVVKHDGSQLHLIGIQPTIPAKRTLKGIREGRDELLEVALATIKGQER